MSSTTPDGCSHRQSGRNCPISKTPCLGECIYANILDDISLGIIGLDVSRKEVFFQNKMAIDIFKGAVRPRDYEALVSIMELQKCLTLKDPTVERMVRYGSKFIGITVFRISESYLWIYVANVTEKVRLDAIAEAVNTMNNLGYIFSGIRHELGNPINSIKTTVSVLRGKAETCSKEMVLDYTDRLLSDINRVELLLKDLRNFSMYEDPRLQSVPIATFLNNFLAMTERDFSERKITVKTHVRADVESGYFDPRALQHVLLNIMTNACDAVQGRPAGEIAISAFKAGDRIIMKIKDNGCGIPEEQKRHLFKPFSTTKTTGTGLGLVIVKKMMTMMNGTVEVESREGGGTSVTLNLPGGRQGNAGAEKNDISH
jgi:signal transduction histidine kinase